MYQGVDISKVQETVDFEWLKRNNQSFVIQRCYVGNDYRDVNYVTNMQKGKDAGLLMGAYNFVYPLPANPAHPNRDPEGQANLHFAQIGGLTENVAVDVEWPEPPGPKNPDSWSKWGCSAQQINDWVLKYLERYTQLSGRKPLIYTYPSFAKTVKFSPNITQYPLWIASYTTTPAISTPFTDWVIWQNSGGQLMKLPNGIPVDTDIAKDLSWFGVVEQAAMIQPAPTIVIQTDPVQPSTPEPMPEPTQQQASIVQSQSSSNTIETLLEILNPIFGMLLPLIKKLFHIR